MSQADQVLEILKQGQTITPMEAYDLFGCLALHSRIAELRKRGWDIRCVIMTRGESRWGSYSIPPAGRAAPMIAAVERVAA